MKTGRLIFIVLFWSSCFSASAQTRTGIPEIDSLPVDDWYVNTTGLSYRNAVLYSLLFPGGGHLYSKHYVKAGFLIGLEGLLLYDAFPAKRRLFQIKNNTIRQYIDSSLFLLQSATAYPDSGQFMDRHQSIINKTRNILDVKMKNLDLKKSETAWALGLHFYGMLDALEIVYKSRGGAHRTLSGKSAFWHAIFVPGGGQLYNRKFGKFGMLWMAIGVSLASARYRQQMVDYFQNRINILKEEKFLASKSEDMNELRKQATLYRKRRNQFFWGMALLHIYSIGDAVVDAILNDFDSPENLALAPGSAPFSLQLLYRF